MSIGEKDVKILWGRSAGRCSYPECTVSCIDFLNGEGFVIGEMAHIIARSPRGPRGTSGGGQDRYDNLILLCPTHHKLVDKAPEGCFSENELREWKERHEQEIMDSLKSPAFKTLSELCRYVARLLIENKVVWKTFGPESSEATANPYSNLAKFWIFRKLHTIVPNNSRIINTITNNKMLFEIEFYGLACQFVEHAKGFEHSCYERLEGIPRFPERFDEMVTRYAAA